MDHSEQVIDPAYAPLRIPCLSPDEYDQLDWASYPERSGYNKEQLLSGDFSQHSPEETAAFLQDWLYFGVLWVVLGRNGSKANYVVADSHGTGIITTKLLNEHIDQRMTDLKDVAQNDLYSVKAILRDIEMCLMTVSKLCTSSTCRDDRRKEFINAWPLSAEIDFSVRDLGEYLSIALRSEWDRAFDRQCYFMFLSFPCAYLPISRMTEEGRCPSERNMVSKGLSSSSAFYATQLKRPRDATRLDHSNCSDTLCEARQVDKSTYRTQHAEADCTCTPLGPSVNEIVSIIQSGQIPLISIETLNTSPFLKVNVEPFKRRKRFIAISHVWSDGLGNSLQNTLPHCQLFRIKSILDDLLSQFKLRSLVNMGALRTLSKKFYGPSLSFWMDTLCIPVQEKHREIRALAIKSMKQIYENAFRVLVLDGEMQASLQGTCTETFMRISLSPWMRRLWTLQEAVCAQRLCVKFADGIFDVKAAYEKFISVDTRKFGGWVDPRKRQHFHRLPASQAQSVYWNLTGLRVNIVDKPELKMIGMRTTSEVQYEGRDIERRCSAIMQAYTATVHRSTSRKDDHFICVASLLGWDLSLLRDVPFEKRMYALLSTETHLPQGLLFMTGPRMTEPGWTWAVDSFGTSKAVDITVPLSDIEPARLTERGLAVQYPGLGLPTSSFDTVEKLRSFRVYARYTEGLIHTFQIQQAGPSIKKDAKAADGYMGKRKFYVLFWDHTHQFLPWVPMMAAVVSAPEVQERENTEKVCEFEFVARFEILSIHDQYKQDVDKEAERVDGPWFIQ
jgi:Heterokaryon incompatibility protein (HET)